MTTQELVNYYANLLILQYVGKPKAYATIQTLITPVLMPQTTVQTLSFSPAPTSGAFVLNFELSPTASINWNDSASTIQGKVRAVSGLGSVVVTGSIASGLTITFTGVAPVAPLLTVSSNTLVSSGSAVSVTSNETDVALPLAVQNAFNLIGDDIAEGVQLDVLGKYAGVTRNGYGFNGDPITLDDSDFLSLIQFAIIKNTSGSSLATIQQLLFQFFPDEILVFDYKNMQMSYLVSSSIGSQNLVQLLVNQGLLPKPMAVALAIVIYAPVINTFFGFRTYELPAFNASPFNSYSNYNLNYPWLSYSNAI